MIPVESFQASGNISPLICVQMATLDKAEALLEDLRSASWDAAVKDLDDVKAFAAKQVCMLMQQEAHSDDHSQWPEYTAHLPTLPQSLAACQHALELPLG